MISFEDVIGRLAVAGSQAEVGEALAQIILAEGYENLVFARLGNQGILELPWLLLPEGFAQSYESEGWSDVDPVLELARSSRAPFSWDDQLPFAPTGASQRRMMAAARSLGVHSGLTIPLHGPGARCDLLSLSVRHPGHRVDPARRLIVTHAALHAWLRYQEIASVADASVAQAFGPSRLGPSSPLDPHTTMSQGATPPLVLSGEHLRALVLVEAGALRWRMGLTELAARTYDLRRRGDIADLESWGLIVDMADDLRWSYYLSPSVLGHAYLRRCPGTSQARAQIWLREVDPSEMPSDLS